MGWQSYAVPIFRNPKNAFQEKHHLNTILEYCREHNDYETHEYGNDGRWRLGDQWLDPTGEDVGCFSIGKIPWKQIPKRFGWNDLRIDNETHLEVLLFGNGGGRTSTYHWFNAIKRTRTIPYEEVQNKLLKSMKPCEEATDIEKKRNEKWDELVKRLNI